MQHGLVRLTMIEAMPTGSEMTLHQ